MVRTRTGFGPKFRGRNLIGFLSLLAVLILLWSGWAWWHYVRSNPVRVFEAMLENNLKTTGVTSRLTASNGAQTLDQTIKLLTTPQHMAQANTTLSNNGLSAASVTTETIGTTSADYVRYLNANQDSNGTSKPFDISKVNDVWGKEQTTKDPTDPSKLTGDLYDQSVLAVVPIGNLPLEQRRELLKQIWDEQVYTPDYARVERRIINGRPAYVYPVAIKADTYVKMLKDFARMLGFTHLEPVDPANYVGGEPIQVALTVDVWSQRLSRIDYASGTRAETLGSFGGQYHVSVPTNTMPIEELRSLVDSLQ